MGSKTSGDFGADFAAIHMDGKVAIAAETDRSLRVLIRQPTKPPRRADRCVRGRDLDALALSKKLLASFPDRLEGVDQAQNRAVTLDQRSVSLFGDRFQGDERRRRLVKSRF